MLKSNAGRRILNILFKVAVGTLVLLAIVACNSSDEDLATSPTPPTGMFSTLPTTEPPIKGDQPPTVELNTPQPTFTPNPTYTPVPTPTPNPTGTPEPAPTPNPTGTPVPTPEPTPQPTPEPTPVPTPQPTPVPTPQPTPVPTPEPTPVPTPDGNNGGSNAAGDGALHRAVGNCNLELVKILIASGANVNSIGSWPTEDMPLHKALKRNCGSAMVQFLVESGADLKALSDWPGEYTPLQLAVRAAVEADSADRDAMLIMVQLLVDLGAEINAGGSTRLHIAVYHCDLDIAKILIAAGANVNSRDGWRTGDMPLHKAIKRDCDSAMVLFLVESGADLKALSDWPGEYTPLQLAVRAAVEADSADRDAMLIMVQLLVDLGADINAGGFSPLENAVANEDSALVRILTGVSN